MQPKRAQPRAPATADERLGDPVRLPRGEAVIVTEHEPVAAPAAIARVPGDQGTGRQVEVHRVRSPCPRRREHRTVGTFHPARAERHAVGVELHVVPTQPEQLGPTRSGDRSQHQQRATARHAHAGTRAACAPPRVWVVDARRASRPVDGRARRSCPRPSPSASPPERGPRHRVSPRQGPRRERAVPDASPTAKLGIERIDDRGGLARRRRCPPRGSNREPRLQQLAHRGTHPHRTARADARDHRRELTLSLAPVAPDRHRSIAAPPSRRVDPDVHPAARTNPGSLRRSDPRSSPIRSVSGHQQRPGAVPSRVKPRLSSPVSSPGDGQSDGHDRHRRATAAPGRGRCCCASVERTTGLEPATLTLAR
jgi:hypothetical protein